MIPSDRLNIVEQIDPPRRQERPTTNSGQAPPQSQTPVIRSLAALRTTVFAPIEYVVPGYIVQGCTLLAGKPKIGKSWFGLDVGLAVARVGGECLGGIKCPQGDVLYLALEDNQRRIQSRVTKVLGYSTNWPEGFHYATEWPRGDAGLVQIRDWIRQNNTRLVIVDTLKMLRPARTDQQNQYDADYASLEGLRRLGSDTEVALLVISHLRKAGADNDPFEKVSGTYGLTAAADTVLILDRDADGTTLYGRGRDIPEVEQAIEFDKATCRWRVLGNADEVRRTSQRWAILAVLQAANGVAMSTAQIRDATRMPYDNVRQLLISMARAGEVKRTKRGSYTTILLP
jgi:hypothetical protein